MFFHLFSRAPKQTSFSYKLNIVMLGECFKFGAFELFGLKKILTCLFSGTVFAYGVTSSGKTHTMHVSRYVFFLERLRYIIMFLLDICCNLYMI